MVRISLLILNMNYLAHAVLSFDDPDILTGNIISDFVKGKKKFLFPIEIQQGIQLHRMIDEFTDHHEATREAKSFFRADYHLYAGAFVDIVYDHFLANDLSEFSNPDQLLKFTMDAYRSINENQKFLPPIFASLFPFMKKENWLYNYRLITGIHKSFNGLVRRAKYMYDPAPAISIFSRYYSALQICYEKFYPDLREFSLKSLNSLRGM